LSGEKKVLKMKPDYKSIYIEKAKGRKPEEVTRNFLAKQKKIPYFTF